MQSLRRAALRSALAASRAAAPKAPATPFATQFTARATAVSVARFFSQTSCFANLPESGDSQALENALNSASETGTTANTANKEAPPGREGETPHGVFIRNISFDATEEHLSEIFEKYGTVTRAAISRDARGLSRGYGFVWMSSAEESARAISEIHGSFWQGRRMQCAPKTSGNTTVRAAVKEPTKFIYIGNIPYETTDAELNRLFKSLENVTDVRVAVDRVTGWPRGFAHADFTTVEAAQRALKQLQGMQLAGRQLRVDFTTGPAKGRGQQQQQQGQQGQEEPQEA